MNSRRVCFFLLLGHVLGSTGCGGGSSSGSAPPISAVPTISSVSPAAATAGGAAFALTINGSNFVTGSSVAWSNPANPGFTGGSANFVSASQLTLQLSAADIAVPSFVKLQIFPPGNGTASNSISFEIAPASAGGAQIVSIGANGAVPNGNSHDPSPSFNGRFIAFSSEATNLTVPSAKFPQGYLRDICLGVDGCTPATLLVSAVSGGMAASPVGGNALGGATPSIGAQFITSASGGAATGVPPAGRYVGFLSAATNLVVPNASFQQAYVRDTCFAAISPMTCVPATTLASVTQSGSEPNAAASAFTFAFNSCNAAFTSAATDVLSGISLPNQIYLVSCPLTAAGGALGSFTLSTTLVSAADGSTSVPANQGAQQPAISADGRWIAFASTSTNLTTTPGASVQQIYLRDTCTAAPAGCAPSTTLVSVDADSNAFTGASQVPAISDQGRFIAFTTQVPAPSGVGITTNVFLRDTCNSSSGLVGGCTPSTSTVFGRLRGGASHQFQWTQQLRTARS
jgi:hypothetical protein